MRLVAIIDARYWSGRPDGRCRVHRTTVNDGRDRVTSLSYLRRVSAAVSYYVFPSKNGSNCDLDFTPFVHQSLRKFRDDTDNA